MELTMVAAGSTTRHVPRGAERDQQRSSHGHDSIRGTRTLIERHHGHKLILSTSMPSESRKIDVQVEMHGQSVPIFEHRDIPPSGSSSSSGDAADAGSSSGTPPPPEQEQQQQEERHSSLTVMHLLPVMLAVSFPDTYPSQQPPKFTLSSSWHSASALSSLCRKFDHLWEEAEHSVVVFAWVTWIRENALQSALDDLSASALSSSSGLPGIVIRTYVPREDDLRDPRAIPVCDDSGRVMHDLLRYDHDRCEHEYWNSSHECGTCWNTVRLIL